MSAERKGLRIALVGCGAVADRHLDDGYAALVGRGQGVARLVATCDVRTARAAFLAARAAAFGIPGVRSCAALDDVLAAPDIEAVDLCVPHPLHAPMALRALAAGKHVLVEKPIAGTVDDGAGMVEAAAHHGCTLCVNENYPFSEPYRRARQLINDAAIGRVVLAQSHRVGYLEGIWLRDGWRQRADLAGGGILLDQGCHYVNILRGLLRDVAGEITHVAAMATTVRDDWQGEDTAVLNLRFASGLLGQQLYCWGTRTPDRGAEATIYGTEGSIDVRSWPPVLVLHRVGRDSEIVLEHPDYAETFARSIEDFALAALSERSPTVTGSEGLVDLKVVAAAYRAIRSRREEPVNEG